jgi:hypothetical protein
MGSEQQDPIGPSKAAGPARRKARSCAEAGQRVARGTTSDCFLWLTDFDCGKSLAPLAFVTRLRKDTRRTLMVQHEGAAGR